jgi:hypothetical protein
VRGQWVPAGEVWSGLAQRVARLEEASRAMPELRVARLAIVDGAGTERIVGEVRDGDAELRLELDAGGVPGRAALVLFAYGARQGLDPTIGVQLCAGDETVAELDVWPDGNGRWRACTRLAADDLSG